MNAAAADVAAALRAAAARLAATSDTPRLDAELLMAHALGTTRSAMLLRQMAAPAPPAFAALVERRAGHEPVAHIVGHQEFYGLELAVTRDTLVPRADSEVLVEAALARLEGSPARSRICDLGTGSGALILAVLALRPQAVGVAVDASAAALAVAQGNAARLGLAARCRFERRDWTQPGWAEGLGRFDLVLCNPPYVEDHAELAPDVRAFEPASALFAGPEGLDDYRRLIPQVSALLAPGGAAIFEIGHAQAPRVEALARAHGLAAVLHRDLAGRPRALVLAPVG